ncbi:uncharacterized protein LOC110955809 isoform X2 [Acanthochromis polyacanthus]|uniref:uncharacterized protein LOC110955809 isoform X2 n=1 Tax=Acanthochromis polyacanthus TaxID=80966 RepID=UPI0022344D2F|nr:uncharacterized protein LOC110955809 isoform X2 [Acanthochromis polyacanthus]
MAAESSTGGYVASRAALPASLGVCASAASNPYRPRSEAQFSALIFVEFVALMIVASPLVQVQAQMDGAVEELFLNVTPLHRAERYIQTELNKLEASDSCCGLRSFEDWENQLPVSCLCSPPPDLDTKVPPANSSSDGLCVVSHQFWVHSKACGPILKSYLSFPIKLRIGIISAFATITMAAIALCLALGLEKYWKTPPVETTVDDYNRVKYQPKPSYT